MRPVICGNLHCYFNGVLQEYVENSKQALAADDKRAEDRRQAAHAS